MTNTTLRYRTEFNNADDFLFTLSEPPTMALSIWPPILLEYAPHPPPPSLPPFLLKFQSFTQYRAQMANKTEEEIEVLSNNVAVWNVHVVLNVLHSLIEKSNINEQLEAYQRGEDPAEVGGPFGGKMLYRYLGYFSLVNLARLHTMLGELGWGE